MLHNSTIDNIPTLYRFLYKWLENNEVKILKLFRKIWILYNGPRVGSYSGILCYFKCRGLIWFFQGPHLGIWHGVL